MSKSVSKRESLDRRRDLALLGKALASDIECALAGLPRVWQPHRSQLPRVAKLVEAGYLSPVHETLRGRFPIKLSGYTLTALGHLTYCMDCEPCGPDGCGSEKK